MRVLMIVLLTALWSCAEAQAGGEVAGVGTAPCSNFNRARETVAEAGYFSWVQGWLSGMNAARKVQRAPYSDLAAMPYQAMLDHVRAYCGSHPKSQLYEAAVDLIGRLPPAVD